jgi:hypothetical protein
LLVGVVTTTDIGEDALVRSFVMVTDFVAAGGSHIGSYCTVEVDCRHHVAQLIPIFCVLFRDAMGKIPRRLTYLTTDVGFVITDAQGHYAQLPEAITALRSGMKLVATANPFGSPRAVVEAFGHHGFVAA